MGKGIEMTSAEQAIIREMSAANARDSEIAAVLKRPRNTVANYRKRHGLQRPDARFGPRKKKLTPPAPKVVPLPYVPWPQIDESKEWPLGCFNDQDISDDVRDREFTRIRNKPPLVAHRFGVPVYG